MSINYPTEIFSNTLGRKFLLNILRFDNGYFISISENESKSWIYLGIL